MARTPVFSEYVVLAGPPTNPANKVASPSPIRVLWRPGSFKKSFPTTVPLVVTSPMCSIKVTQAIGAMERMAPSSNFGRDIKGTPFISFVTKGILIHAADVMAE